VGLAWWKVQSFALVNWMNKASPTFCFDPYIGLTPLNKQMTSKFTSQSKQLVLVRSQVLLHKLEKNYCSKILTKGSIICVVLIENVVDRINLFYWWEISHYWKFWEKVITNSMTFWETITQKWNEKKTQKNCQISIHGSIGQPKYIQGCLNFFPFMFC
jgi:hypothetical protein